VVTRQVVVVIILLDHCLDEGVPWRMQCRWFNCMQSIMQLRFNFSHIPREGNMNADELAKNGHGLPMHSSQCWTAPPSFMLSLLDRDKLGLPFSRLYMT